MDGCIGLLTVAFALGQLVGPVAAGYLADGAGDVRPALALAVGLLALATALALVQRERQPGGAKWAPTAGTRRAFSSSTRTGGSGSGPGEPVRKPSISSVR